MQSIRRHQPNPAVPASPVVVMMPMHDAEEERRWDEQAARIMSPRRLAA